MLKVGITGGIGSGKTTICRIFQTLNVPVFNADDVAKTLMTSDDILVRNIKLAFGGQAYLGNGELNRKYLANIVFNDEKQLQVLNELVHPATIQAFKKWAKQQDSIYCLHEAAILFESGAFKTCDYSILISAPEDIRIARVMKRDEVLENEVRTRMDKQMPEEQKKKMANFIILNDESESVIPQVLKLHQFLSQKKLCP